MDRGKFVIVVLDGFGVGQMKDVPEVRPSDIGANTCIHIFEECPSLHLPALSRLGLANVIGFEFDGLPFSKSATWGSAELAHQGADTFYGHQEIMGTRPPVPVPEPFQVAIEQVMRELSNAGYSVRVETSRSSGLRFLIVNEACTVADNVECDPGQAFNVTASLDDMEFETELSVGRIVRSIARTPRVITFGGRGVHLEHLLAAVEEHDGYIGINAPASGVYSNDYHCIHMGYGVDETVQAPYLIGSSGIDVRLLGKAADVCANKFGQSESIVDTKTVLGRTLALVEEPGQRFICANVQETDLMGHRENVEGYAEILRVADGGIEKIANSLRPEDVLVVMADHGNDPTIGHPHHTRERVPLLIAHNGAPVGSIGTRKTLSDVGATACEYFDAGKPQNGESFLAKIGVR